MPLTVIDLRLFYKQETGKNSINPSDFKVELLDWEEQYPAIEYMEWLEEQLVYALQNL